MNLKGQVTTTRLNMQLVLAGHAAQACLFGALRQSCGCLLPKENHHA